MSISKWAYTPEVCDGKYCVGDCDRCSLIETIDVLMEDNKFTAADMVKVVRCKDCKYWKELLPVCERIHRAGWGVNDFCSFGERADT